MSCIETGVRSTSAREVTISLTSTPGPPTSAEASRQSCRNAELVMPAIGANTTGVAISRSPNRNEVDLAAGRVALDTGLTGPLCRLGCSAGLGESDPVAAQVGQGARVRLRHRRTTAAGDEQAT